MRDYWVMTDSSLTRRVPSCGCSRRGLEVSDLPSARCVATQSSKVRWVRCGERERVLTCDDAGGCGIRISLAHQVKTRTLSPWLGAGEDGA